MIIAPTNALSQTPLIVKLQKRMSQNGVKTTHATPPKPKALKRTIIPVLGRFKNP